MSCNNCITLCTLNPCFDTTVLGTIEAVNTYVDLYFERLSDGRIYVLNAVQTDGDGVLSIAGGDLVPGFLDFLDFGGSFRVWATVVDENNRYDITPYTDPDTLSDTAYNCLTLNFEAVNNVDGRLNVAHQNALVA